MLQWMGGSRRKVNASRKSMLNKQKHYFEQRKRQQQRTGLDNHIGVSRKWLHYNEEVRSLDILNFINLATVTHEGIQLETSLANNCSSAILPEKTSETQNLSSKVEGLKLLAASCECGSNSAHFKSQEIEGQVQGENLVLSLLNADDEDREIDNKAKVTPETHVAFSVGGLGKVGVETPAHSPRTQSGFNSPSRGVGLLKNSSNFRSMSSDLGLELSEAMYDISKLIHRDSEVFHEQKFHTYEKRNRESSKFVNSSIYSDVLDDMSDFLGSNNENFQERPYGLREYSNDILDDSFMGIWEHDAACDIKSYSRNHTSVISNANILELNNSFFGDFSLDTSRFGAEQHKRHSNSEIEDPSCSLSAIEKECNLIFFDKDGSNFNLPSWSFTENENLPDSASSLSEGSCTSTAAREDKSYEFLSHSAKLRSKKRHLSDLDITFINLNAIKKNHMDEMDISSEPEKDKFTPNQLNSKARYCSKVSPRLQRIPDPSFIFPQEELSDFKEETSRSKMPVDHANPFDFSFANDRSELSGFSIQNKNHKQTRKPEVCSRYSFFPGDNEDRIPMPEPMRQRNASINKGDVDGSSSKLENKILGEKSLCSQISRENEATQSDCAELNHETEKQSFGYESSETKDSSEETNSLRGEVSGLQTYINQKLELDCSTPDPNPIQILNKGSVEEKMGSEVAIFRSLSGKDFSKEHGTETTMKFDSLYIRLLHKEFIWKLTK